MGGGLKSGAGVTVYLAPPGQLAPPGGGSCPGISCPPPWLSSRPGGKLSSVTVYLAPPGQLAPPGGGKLSRDILPPTLVIFTPGGQAVQASCPILGYQSKIILLSFFI